MKKDPKGESMPEEKWYKSVKYDSRFERGKYYANIWDARSMYRGDTVKEVYGPFENYDSLDKFFEKLGFHYEEEVGWEMQPITVIESRELGKEATILGDPNR